MHRANYSTQGVSGPRKSPRSRAVQKDRDAAKEALQQVEERVRVLQERLFATGELKLRFRGKAGWGTCRI